jgi:hypothetical protein
MIFALPENHPVGVIHPIGRRDEVVKGSMSITGQPGTQIL